MLPPVRAALSSTADYQSPAQAAISPARATVSQGNSQPQSESEAILSNARLDAASLSAQLKLAQGSSIFAETIGKLLKTPRRENETLIDYTARLFEAVQALKPQEVANVERLLNQIVKGISLRLMAEILKEPTGPTAARLAAHIETANLAQRDLATKTVVSFYRQNASADAPPDATKPWAQQSSNSTSAPTSQTGQAPATSTNDRTAAVRQSVTNDASSKAAEGQNQRPTATPASSTVSSTATPATIRPDQTAETARPANRTIGQANTPPSQAASGGAGHTSSEATLAVRPAISQTAVQNSPQQSTVVPQGDQGKVTTPLTGNPVPGASDEATRQTAAVKPNEIQALARTAVEIFKLDVPVPTRLWSGLSDQTLLKLANWLATALSELDLPETAHSSSPSSAVQTAVDDKPIAQHRVADGQIGPASSQSSPATAATQAANGSAPDAARIAAATLNADTADQQMTAMAGAAATLTVQAREPLPWPFVAAYPPAEDEPRREHRKAQPIEAIEDEEQDGSSQQHAFGEEQQPSEGEEPQADADGDEQISGDTMTAAEKAAGYRAGEAKIEADAPEARPSDLYWRMAGWT